MDAMARAGALAVLNGSALELLVARLRALARLLRELAASTLRASPVGWFGAGRRAYDAAAGRAAGQLLAQAGTLEAVGLALGALADTLHAVQAEAAQARRIVSTGTAGALGPIESELGPALTAFDDADRRCAALLFDALLGPAMARVGVTPTGSAVLAATLGSRAAALSGDATRPRRLPEDPVAVSLWWAGKSVQARDQLGPTTWFGSHFLAGRDGMPTRFRDTANRARLAQALEAAKREYTDLAGVLVHGLVSGLEVFARELPWPLSWAASKLDPLLNPAKQRLVALQRLTKALERKGSELLEFDGSGDGRALVASADVDTSRNVAVLVPGMNIELDDISRLLGESAAVAAAAGAGSAVVTWLGYDTPSVWQVAGDGKAEAGAIRLIAFTRGERVTATLRQRVTVIGHSYGTLVAGLAAKQAPIADNLVLLASPGVEASSATELKVPAGHVWAVRAGTDPIQAVFWPAELGHLLGLPEPRVFGPDPAAGSFGAAHFGVGGAYGHSGYYTSGSQSLHNLGRIVSGRPTTR